MVPHACNNHFPYFLFRSSYCTDQGFCKRAYASSEMVLDIQYSVWDRMDCNYAVDWRLCNNKCPGCSVDQRRKSMDDGRIISGMFKTTLNAGDKLCC